MIDWNDAYANAAHIPDADRIRTRWLQDAERYRARARWRRIPYGDAPREVLDVFRPADASEGLVVFVHGGYWHSTDPFLWSHLAQGAVERGWTVVMPGYTLAPEARIAHIGLQIVRAVRRAGDLVTGPIRLCGHSAGGHLALRSICADTTLPASFLDRIGGVTSISGVHDLRPLMWTDMNETLQLDEGEAVAESPALQRPIRNIPVTAWVGADERPAFVLQARQLAAMWTALGQQIRLQIEPGRHHFDVIDGLRDPESPLLAAILA